jgi:hypothetical protein
MIFMQLLWTCLFLPLMGAPEAAASGFEPNFQIIFSRAHSIVHHQVCRDVLVLFCVRAARCRQCC